MTNPESVAIVDNAEIDILLVGYFPPVGAIAELFTTIANSLADFARVGVLAPADAPATSSRVVDIRFPYRSRRPDTALFGAGFGAHRRAAAMRPEITLLFTQHPLNLAAAAHLRRSRLAFWWHEPASRGQVGVLKRIVYRCHDAAIVPVVDRIVLATTSLMEGVPPRHRRKVRVVPFPLPEGFDSDSGRFADSRTDLVFFGKLAPYKGLDVLAEALERLAGTGVCPTLRVVGSGPLEANAPRLARFADRHPGAVDHVDEYAKDEDIVSALRTSKICVLPYLTAAGSSTIAVVGSQGRALVASRCGSFDDFLTDGSNARLCPAGDPGPLSEAIAELLVDEPGRRRLGEALESLTIDQFTPARVAETLSRALAI